MIRITKTVRVPIKLSGDGAALKQEYCDAYDADPASYANGTKNFDFDGDVYGASSVKKALSDAQHGKCCFCEAKILHIDYGDVEHFRPKKAYKQTKGQKLQHPGYYWLAYDWNNLFLSCAICNQRFKGNLFPLDDPANRAQLHDFDIDLEDPVFVHPSDDDPEVYISFHDEIPVAINGNKRGTTTISWLGLDREKLNEHRRIFLSLLKNTKIVANSQLPQSQEAQELLQELIKDKSEYASMTRVFLAN